MNICITGSSQGLGQALCRAFVASGHRVWGVARNTDTLQALEQELGKDAFLWTSVDITEEQSMKQWKQEMEELHFIPDIVILNASVQLDDMKDDGLDVSKSQQVIETNLLGSLRCIELVLPGMLMNKAGSIVAITSTASLRPSDRSASYAASKAGIAMAMRSLKQRYRSSGVRFATVCLGPIATDMWEGKRNGLVPGVDKAAKATERFSLSGGSIFYYPFLTTLLLRLSLWLPDSLFAAVSRRMMK